MNFIVKILSVVVLGELMTCNNLIKLKKNKVKIKLKKNYSPINTEVIYLFDHFKCIFSFFRIDMNLFYVY